MNRIVAVNHPFREIAAGKYERIEDAEQQLEAIRNMPSASPWRQVLAPGVGSGFFCVLFGVPKRCFLNCRMIGLAGRLVYRLSLIAGLGTPFTVLFAAVVITLCSRITAVRRQCPTTVFMITSIFLLVPGTQIY